MNCNEYDEYVTWRRELADRVPAAMGVYVIYCRENDAYYIGAGFDMRHRVENHLYEMRIFESHPLGQEYRKYGKESMGVACLEIISDAKNLSESEQSHYRIIKSLEEFGLRVKNTALPGKNRHWDS